jgi:glutathione-independent formaldehyde dehydrogenase
MDVTRVAGSLGIPGLYVTGDPGGLMEMILHDRAHIADAVNATVVTLDEAPKGYADFDKGAAKKFVLNPHGDIKV